MPAEAKVFIMRGGYTFIRAALLRRGWVENEDGESDFFDYKWVLKTRQIYRERLHECQAVNHFSRSFACLTTKVGLIRVRSWLSLWAPARPPLPCSWQPVARSAAVVNVLHFVQALQDMQWAFSEPSTAIHPRAYNLSQDADFQQFEADFRWTAAAAVLRTALRDGGYHPGRVPTEEVLQLALTVCRARLDFIWCALGVNICCCLHRCISFTHLQHKLACRDLTETDEHRGTAPELPALSAEQWDTLLNAPLFGMATCMKYTKTRKSSGRAAHTRSAPDGASESDEDASSETDTSSDEETDAEAPPWAPAEAPPWAPAGGPWQARLSATSSARIASGRVLERLSSLGSAEVAAVEEARAGAHFAAPHAACAAAPLCPKLRNEVRGRAVLARVERRDSDCAPQWRHAGGAGAGAAAAARGAVEHRRPRQHLDSQARRQVARPRHPLLQQPAQAAPASAAPAAEPAAALRFAALPESNGALQLADWTLDF